MKQLLTIIALIAITIAANAQAKLYDAYNLKARTTIELKGKTITDFTDDTVMANKYKSKIMSEWATKKAIENSNILPKTNYFTGLNNFKSGIILYRNENAIVAPEMRWWAYRQKWVQGVDVANNGGGGDFVMLADEASNGSVRDLIYVNRNKEGDNSISDDSGYPTIGFWYTPSSRDVQTMFNVPDVKPNRDVVGIRKSAYTSNNSKMLSFYDSGDTIADFWVNSLFQFEPFLKVKGDLSVLSKDINNTSVLRLNANPSDNSSDFILKNYYSGGTGYEFRLSNYNIDYLKINPYFNKATFNGIVLANAGVDTLATKSYARSIITGGATSIVSSNLTEDKALISNGTGKVATSSVTATELGYVGGVTSSIQTQLNSKLNAANSNVKRYIRVNATTNGSNYAMDGTKEVVLIDYTDPCDITLPVFSGLPDGSVFEIQFYNWGTSGIAINVYPEGSNSEEIDAGHGISSTRPRILFRSNNQSNSVTPLSLRIMWLASDNVWTVLQGGVFDY
ncbi:MAG: hypothetical protein LC096_06705 [Bacteroidia bacterium]|nr:hypothetical protein [Bacteroidia bacterium]